MVKHIRKNIRDYSYKKRFLGLSCRERRDLRYFVLLIKVFGVVAVLARHHTFMSHNPVHFRVFGACTMLSYLQYMNIIQEPVYHFIAIALLPASH